MTVTIRDVMTDPALFGNQFGGESFAAWRALFSGFYGLVLDEAEQEHWQALTGRTGLPTEPHDELDLVIGRRGGKTQGAALIAVYEAAFRDYHDRLSPGEVATIMVLAADRKQARSAFRYISGLIDSNAMLRQMVVREDKESIQLSNRTAIEVHTASSRAVRGYSVACCIADECAYWRSEDSANPDHEILNAIRPAMATLDGKMVVLSSPYNKRGVLWDTYRNHYGQQSPVLVAQADSRTMNPSLPQRIVDEAYERDPTSAASEYGAQFRSDIDGFINRDLVDAAARPEPLIIPVQQTKDVSQYVGFVDVAGGGADEYTLSIAHLDGDTVVIDGVWAERGDPAEITAKYAEIIKKYRIRRIMGDRYAAQWPVTEFKKFGITLAPADRNRSELYLEFLPILQTGRVELPPDTRTLVQFASLERRAGRSGKDSVDHPPGGHDDRANAIAGACWTAKHKRFQKQRPMPVTFQDSKPQQFPDPEAPYGH